MSRERARGRTAAAFRHEMMTAYFAGYFWGRWRERRAGVQPARLPEPPPQRTSKVVTTGR